MKYKHTRLDRTVHNFYISYRFTQPHLSFDLHFAFGPSYIDYEGNIRYENIIKENDRSHRSSGAYLLENTKQYIGGDGTIYDN